MFINHQPIISEFARASPDNMAKVLKFVVLTIRNRLFNLPADMETLENTSDPRELNGILYGFKMDSVIQIDLEIDMIYTQAEIAYYHAENDREAAEALLAIFTQITGFGLVKAGFACQLIYGVSGCLDTHNIERFGLNPNAFKSSKFKNAKTLKTKRRHLTDYCDTVDKFGGTAKLWDTWCAYVYNRASKVYQSAYHVSEIHCEAIGLRRECNGYMGVNQMGVTPRNYRAGPHIVLHSLAMIWRQ